MEILKILVLSVCGSIALFGIIVPLIDVLACKIANYIKNKHE